MQHGLFENEISKLLSKRAQFDYFSNVSAVLIIKSHIFVTLLTEQKQGVELMQQVKIGKIFIVFS